MLQSSGTSLKAGKSDYRTIKGVSANVINIMRAVSPGVSVVQGRFIESELLKHVPDLVATIDHNKKPVHVKQIVGVLMLIDTAGFAGLIERHAQNSSSGFDQLTTSVNSFISSIVGVIMEAKGDVIKFTGDAILVNWTIGNSYDDLKETIVKVIQGALRIQEKCGEHVTDVGVKLKLKIGVACGDCCVIYLGNDQFRHYVMCGKGIEDVMNAERTAEFGTVVLSPYIWSFCNKKLFEYSLMSDQRHVKILEILKPEPLKDVAFQAGAGGKVGKVGVFPRPHMDPRDLFVPQSKINRKVLNTALELGAVEKIKLYVPKPVTEKLDQNQLADNLCEMRQVSIMVVYMLLDETLNREDQIPIVDKAFNTVWELVQFYEGCINKVVMFAGGCTMLILFGIHCFKHDNDSARALQCGNQIHMSLRNFVNIKTVSVGVTTGPTFCGVVGHELRHEYCVIGRRVGMAARLMMYYPGRVTCDNDTFLQSKISRQYFREMVERPVKGLSNLGTIREYSEELKEASVLDVQQFSSPLLDREKELGVFTEVLKNIQDCPNDPTGHNLIVFESETGMGKSHTLDSVISLSEHMTIDCYSCAVTMNDSLTELYVIRTLLMQILNMDPISSPLDRESLLVSTFFHRFLRDNFFVLNDVLSTQFRTPEQTAPPSLADKRTMIQRMLLMMFEQLCKDRVIVLVVDDGHFIDDHSWRLISELTSTVTSILFVTGIKLDSHGTPASCISPSGSKVLNHRKTLVMRLNSLNPQFLSPLACQILDVCAVPVEVDDILKKRSEGKPVFVETILKSLYTNGDIQIIPKALLEQNDLMQEFEFVIPNGALLKRRASVLFPRRGQCETMGNIDEEAQGLDPRQKICVVTPGVKLMNTEVPDVIKGGVLVQLEGLTTSERHVLRCAAVIGENFSRETLHAIMINTDLTVIQSSLDTLFDKGFLLCDSMYKAMRDGFNKTVHGEHPSTVMEDDESSARLSSGNQRVCFCPHISQFKLEGSHKNSVRCGRMRFRSTLVQDTVYRTFTMEQRRMLHGRITCYLEEMAHKCAHCGGGEFLTPIAVETSPLLGMPMKKQLKRMKPQRQRQKSKTDVERTKSISLKPNPKGLTEEGSNFPIKAALSNNLRFDTLVSEMDAPLDEVDLRDCNCSVVLSTVFPVLVHHCEMSGDPIKMIHVCSQAAVAAIQTHSADDAIAYLLQAEFMMKGFKQGVNMLLPEENVNESLMVIESEARVHALFGLAYFHMGMTEESLPRLNESLRILGRPQPSYKWTISLKLKFEFFKQWLHITFPNHYFGCASPRKSIRFLEATHSLCYLFQMYFENKDYKMALLVAMQEVNLAEESNEDLHELIVAYTNVMQACIVNNKRDLARTFEKSALSRCATIIKEMDPDDFVNISHLFVLSLRLRLSLGKLKEALDSADKAYVIADKIHDNIMEVDLFPLYSHTLAMCGKDTYGEILKKLDRLADETGDLNARCWYYSCTLYMTLETGFQPQEIEKCIAFGTEIMETQSLVKEALPRLCLFANICTWFSRHRRWQEAEQWFRLATSCQPKDMYSFLAITAIARIVECELLACANALTDANRTTARVTELKNNITRYFKKLVASCNYFPVLLPRYHILMAYWKAMQGKKNLMAGERELQRSIKLSTKMGNERDMLWAQQNLDCWVRHKDPLINWLELTDPETHRTVCHSKAEPVRFTLPLPYMQWSAQYRYKHRSGQYTSMSHITPKMNMKWRVSASEHDNSVLRQHMDGQERLSKDNEALSKEV